MSWPKIGLIYLTLATEHWQRDIDGALQSLEGMEYPKDQVELICIESKTPLAPLESWFRERWMPKAGVTLPRITYLSQDAEVGFSGNNNRGYETAKTLGCKYVYLLNEDADVDPNFLRRAVERAERDPRAAYVQSLILLCQDRGRVNTVGNAYHFLGFGYSHGYMWTRERAKEFFDGERARNPDLEIGYASGAGVLARVSAVEACGGLFDEKFFSYHEDTDASLQARIRGYKIVVEPRSIIYHHYVFGKRRINYYWMERNRYVILFSYYRLRTLLCLLPMLLAMDVAILFFSVIRGWGDMKWKVYQDWIKPDFWQWIGERRRKIQCERVIGDRKLLLHAVCQIAFQGEAVENPILTHIGNPVLCAYWSIIKHFI